MCISDSVILQGPRTTRRVKKLSDQQLLFEDKLLESHIHQRLESKACSLICTIYSTGVKYVCDLQQCLNSNATELKQRQLG